MFNGPDVHRKTHFHDLEILGAPGKDSFAEGALTFFFSEGAMFSYVFWLLLKIPPQKMGETKQSSNIRDLIHEV